MGKKLGKKMNKNVTVNVYNPAEDTNEQHEELTVQFDYPSTLETDREYEIFLAGVLEGQRSFAAAIGAEYDDIAVYDVYERDFPEL